MAVLQEHILTLTEATIVNETTNFTFLPKELNPYL